MVKKVSTHELFAAHPSKKGGQPVSQAIGTTRVLAEHAAYIMWRKFPKPDERDLDQMTKELKKLGRSTIQGITFTIEPIVEEYEVDEDDE